MEAAAIAKVCVVGGLAVVAIGLVGYIVYRKYYKKKSKEKAHGMGRLSPSDGGEKSSNEVLTMEEIKSQVGLRHRNVASKSVDSQTSVSTEDSGVQTDGDDDESEIPRKSNVFPNSIEIQTNFMSSDMLNNELSYRNTLSDAISDVTSDSQTVVSFSDSVDSVIEDWNTSTVPQWNEMSDYEKGICTCYACDREVNTLTVPCNHPYMCYECVIHFYPRYVKCPYCAKSLMSYRNI